MSASSSLLWGNLISGLAVFVATAGLLGTIGGMRVTPIEQRLDAIDKRIDKIDLTMAPLLTLYAQHTSDLQVIASMQKEIDSKLNEELFRNFRKGIAKQIQDDKESAASSQTEISHQVHNLEDKFVTRAESKDHWDETVNRIDDLTKRLADLATRLNVPPIISPK